MEVVTYNECVSPNKKKKKSIHRWSSRNVFLLLNLIFLDAETTLFLGRFAVEMWMFSSTWVINYTHENFVSKLHSFSWRFSSIIDDLHFCWWEGKGCKFMKIFLLPFTKMDTCKSRTFKQCLRSTEFLNSICIVIPQLGSH